MFHRILWSEGLSRPVQCNEICCVVRGCGMSSARCLQVRGRGPDGKSGNSRSTVSVEEDGNAALPEPLLERPEGAPPLSDLSSDSLALILDGPSLVSLALNPVCNHDDGVFPCHPERSLVALVQFDDPIPPIRIWCNSAQVFQRHEMEARAVDC